MVSSRVITSVLLSHEEERRLKRLARGQAFGSTLLRLARKDVDARGPSPAVVSAVPPRPVARKLSVAIPLDLSEGIDARRGTASHGAYLRSLLGVTRDEQTVPPAVRVVCRAARPLPVGRLDQLVDGRGDGMDFVELVPDVADLEERWNDSYWEGISPGEVGWALLGLQEPGGMSVFTSRGEGEVAFGQLRGLFRDAGSNVRVVLHPSFVFRRYVRGRRIGASRWVECEEHECEDVVVAVRVEPVPLARP